MTPVRPLLRSTVVHASIVAVLVLLFFLLQAPHKVRLFAGDSFGYLRFADALLSGDLFRDRDPASLPVSWIFRTPGYPLVLALTRILSPDGFPNSVLTAHALLAFAATLLLALCLRSAVPPLVTGGLAFLLVLLPSRGFAETVLTEWLASNLLLAVLALSYLHARHRSLPTLAGLGAVCAYLALTRPVLSFVVVLPVASALLFSAAPLRRALPVVALTLLPVFGWILFNQHRLGAPVMTALGPFSPGLVVGNATTLDGDDEQFASFVEAFNAAKKTALPEEIARNGDLSLPVLQVAWNHNLWEAAWNVTQREGWGWVTHFEFVNRYGLRSIRQNREAYARFVAAGIRNLAGRHWPLLLLAGLAAWSLRRGQHRELVWAAAVMAFVHLAHTAIAILGGVILARYFELTFRPLLLAIALLGVACLASRWGGRGAPPSPGAGAGQPQRTSCQPSASRRSSAVGQ